MTPGVQAPPGATTAAHFEVASQYYPALHILSDVQAVVPTTTAEFLQAPDWHVNPSVVQSVFAEHESPEIPLGLTGVGSGFAVQV